MAAWCEARGEVPGRVLSLERTWALARAWYGDRLDPGFRGRTAEGARAIFRGVGLEGEFWEVG